MRAYVAVVAVGTLLPAAIGCRPTDACAEAATACGGDPIGAWGEVDVCQDPALPDSTIAKRTYRGQSAVTAGQAPPEPTSTDWCSDLVYGPNGITFLLLPRDTPRILGASLRYSAAGLDDPTRGQYSALVTSSDRTSIEYSASCLERFGYAPGSCAQFGEAFAAYGVGLGGVKETTCKDSVGGGCLCSYLSESDAAGTNLSGSWSTNGHVLTHYAANMVLPSQVDYCVQGNRMTLWGHDRTNILDFAGLRTMILDKVVCGDGRVDRGEECDPPNQTTCNAMCQRILTP